MPADDVPIEVRMARAADEAQLARLDQVAWSPASGFPSVARQAGDLFFTAGSPPQAHLVGTIGGAVVGYIRLAAPSPLPEEAHVVAVHGLAVAPEARRRGVATALLGAAERRARDRGARKLSLRVLSTNPTAIRLYQQFGFEQEGRLVGEFFINGHYVDDLLLTKHLGTPPRNGSATS
jgi:ribosomal protein S18 acetylase RimI-like enzyme